MEAEELLSQAAGEAGCSWLVLRLDRHLFRVVLQFPAALLDQSYGLDLQIGSLLPPCES